MSDKNTYEKLQEQLQERNPFENIDYNIYEKLKMVDDLEGEKNNIKEYFIKNKSEIKPESELKCYYNILKIKEIRNLISKFKKIESDYMKELDDQLDKIENKELKNKLVELVEKEI